jgi:uncharacterized membrane protein YfcA
MSDRGQAAPPWRLVQVGVLAGFLCGLFGVGGGVLIVPALVVLCRQGQRQAVATSLLAIGPLAVAGMVGYAAHRQVDPYLALPLVAGTVVGAWIGAALLRRVSPRVLRLVFSAAVLSAAIRLVVDPGVPVGDVRHELWRLAILVPIGTVVGILAGLTGIGGGAMMVPIMQLFFAVPAALAKGTSLLVILPTALLAGWRNLKAHLGSARDATWIGISGTAAALGASAISVRLPGLVADLLFGCFLIAVAVRTVWSDLWAWRTRPSPDASGR